MQLDGIVLFFSLLIRSCDLFFLMGVILILPTKAACLVCQQMLFIFTKICLNNNSYTNGFSINVSCMYTGSTNTYAPIITCSN